MAELGRDPLPEMPTAGRGRRPRRLGLVALVTVTGIAVLSVLVVAAPSGKPLAASGSAAPSPRGPALIAVVDDSGALSTVDGRGGSRVSYPAPGVVFGFPAWSPDGSRIAAVGQNGTDSAIYVFAVDRAAGTGGAPTIVYRSPDRPPFYLYWTPDGRRIGFLTTEPDGLALRVAPVDGSRPLDGGDQASVIRRGQPLYFDWVDARKVLLHVGLGVDAFVGQVGLDGAPVGSRVAGTGSFRAASMSPDGRYVAYEQAVTDTTADIVVATQDGTASHRIPAFGPAAMVFDPAGDTLAAIAAEEPATQPLDFPLGPLRLIDAATGTSRVLLDGQVVAFFWAPDGRTIAALRVIPPGQGPVAGAGDFALAGGFALPGGFALAVANVPRSSTDGVDQAEGTRVVLSFVDVSTGSARPGRVVLLAAHFVGELLPYFDQYALSHRLWSPDGASLLLPLVDPSGRDQLVVIPADGSDPRPIAGGAKGFWSP